jgi:invasion protein IalB
MKYVFSLAAAALIAGSAGALAQTAPVGAATDVKTFGDFTVRCFPVKSLSPCDMYQERSAKDTGQKILSMSVAYVPSSNVYGIQVSVPLGVAIQKGLVIQASGVTTGALPYHRCDRAGCYVEMRMEKDMVDKLIHSDPNAKIKIVADNGKSFDLNFSLNGFGAANDAMVDLAKAKATTPPATTGADASAPAK